MSQKDKQKKQQKIRQKAVEKTRKRKKKQESRRKKSDRQRAQQARVDNLAAQLQEQQTPSFDRAAFQASAPSKNIPHGSVRSAVLSSRKPKVGFDKAAWKPPGEDDSEDTQTESDEPVEGFNKAAWAPPNGDTEE